MEEPFLLLLSGDREVETLCLPVRSYSHVSFHWPNNFEFSLVLLDISHSGVPSRCLRSPAVAQGLMYKDSVLTLYNEWKQMVRRYTLPMCPPAIPSCAVNQDPQNIWHEWIFFSKLEHRLNLAPEI